MSHIEPWKLSVSNSKGGYLQMDVEMYPITYVGETAHTWKETCFEKTNQEASEAKRPHSLHKAGACHDQTLRTDQDSNIIAWSLELGQ